MKVLYQLQILVPEDGQRPEEGTTMYYSTLSELVEAYLRLRHRYFSREYVFRAYKVENELLFEQDTKDYLGGPPR